MEILWLVIGLLIGLLVAWWFFADKCRKQLAQKDAELADARRQSELDLEQERRAHEATRKQLADAEQEAKALNQRADSLDAELADTRKELDTQTAHYSEAAAQLRRTVSDVNSLKSELEESKQANVALSKELEEANTARASTSDTNQSRILELESRVSERDSEIARLQAELGAARSTPQDYSPAYSLDERTEGATASTSEASPSPSDDLTRIKGIGRVLQGKLHQLGVNTFRQIAEFSRTDIERVNSVLDFPGRIERERWVEQAKAILGAAD